MTSRERLIASVTGGKVDRTPILAWPGEGASDATVCTLETYDATLRETGEGNPRKDVTDESPVILIEVTNPFGKAMAEGTDLNRLLADDPANGGDVLDRLVAETREDMICALDGDADGIVYRLHGACADHCSPMQYGGHYLERDRELLEWATEAARLNFLFVVGDRDLYLDFVSDLPAHLFGWDDRTSGVTSDEGRALRGGPVATFDPGSDVLLATPYPSVAQLLEKPTP